MKLFKLFRGSDKNAQLDAVYAEMPTVQCKGLCFGACGPVPATVQEAKRMEALSGEPFTFDFATRDCGYLKDNRCSVYSARPLVCRAYGVSDGLLCEHGCERTGTVSKDDGRAFFMRVRNIGGDIVMPRPKKPL